VASKQLVLDIIARDKTKAGFNSASKHAGGLRKAVGGIATGIAAIGLTAFAKDSVNTFQKVTKESLALNRAVGGTVAESSKLRFAAKMSGQEMDAFTRSMGLLDKNLVKAAQSGKGPVFDSMKKMGVSFTDAAGKVKPLTETLPDMAEVFAKMPNGPEKTALALQLFGRSGAALLPFLNKGKAGIEDLMKQTEDYNQVIDDDQVESYKKNLEAQRKFDQAMTDIKMTLGEDLLPAITPIIEQLGNLAKAFGDLPQPVQTGLVGLAVASLAFSALSGPIGAVSSGLGGLGGLFGSAGAAGATAAGGIGAAGSSIAVLAGILATAAGAFAGFKISEELGGISSAMASVMIPGAAFGTLLQHIGETTPGAEEGLRAVKQAIGDMATSGDIDGLVTKWAQMERQMTPDELIKFAQATPGLEQALANVGLRVDAVTGKIERMPKKPGIKVSAETKAAVRKLDEARQKALDADHTDPNISVSVNVGGTIGMLQAVIDKAREAKQAVSGAGGSGGGGSWAKGGPAHGLGIVGERGPELVALPQGSHVFTASQTRSMVGVENFAKGKKSNLSAKQKAWKKKQLASLRKKTGGRWESSNTASLREALASARESASSSFLGQAGLISGYDPNALADAQAEAQAAQEDINSSAVGSSARQSGMARLKAARQKIADAPTSVMDWVRKRVAKMGRWTAALGRLSKVWGGTPGGQQLLREIWEKGPDGGLELADELEKAPGSVQELLNGANQAAAYAGVAAEYNPDVMNAGAAYNAGAAGDRQLVLTSIVQVEGIQVVKAIQKFKQSQGGRELGIA